MVAASFFFLGTFISQLFVLFHQGSLSIVLRSSETLILTGQYVNQSSFHNKHPGQYFRYFELHEQVIKLANELTPEGTSQPGSYSAYSRALVVTNAPWLPPRRMCKETCCVEAVAISLDQDKHQIIQCTDGSDLADITSSFDPRAEGKRFHAAGFHEALLPCLVPGTIINMHSMFESSVNFWEKYRAKIQVPFVLMTTGTDINSPQMGDKYIGDTLLLHWYGTNPVRLTEPSFQEHAHKFRPMKLGLSGGNHPHERYMLPYLKLNNFTNPFLDKSRWDLSKQPLHFDKDVFVKYGNHWLQHRTDLWQSLCPNTTHFNTTSCGSAANLVPVDQTYADMSRYRFGVSPPGAGWDCYRTYEMLYLGVIPLVEIRDSYSHELFQGLPVILVPKLGTGTTRKDVLDAIHNYIASDVFQNASFEAGWESLFFSHRRRQILKDSGRDEENLIDDNGREYYQAYRYTVLGAEQATVNQVEQDLSWIDQPRPLSEHDESWLRKWKKKGNLASG